MPLGQVIMAPEPEIEQLFRTEINGMYHTTTQSEISIQNEC